MSKPETKPEAEQPAPETINAAIPEEIIKQATKAVAGENTEELKAKLEDAKETALRALADAENTRKRAQRDIEEANKYGIASFAKDLLSVLENLQRTIDAVPADAAQNSELLKNLVTGVDLTRKELLSVFERRGIRPVEPKPGEKFDHSLHQAIAQVEDPKFEQGAIIQLARTGYIIHDRLLQPAMVTVSKGIVKAQPDQPKVDTTA